MHQYLPLLMPLAVMAIFARRMLRTRRFRVATLWIAPILLAALLGFTLFHQQPSPAQASELAGALFVGGAIGWFRARLTKIAIDSATGVITQRGTPYGLLLFAALFVMRSTARVYAMQHPELGIDVNRALAIFLGLAFGLVLGYASGVTVGVARARRGLAELPPVEGRIA